MVMKPIISEIAKIRKTLETFSATINKSLEDVGVVVDTMDHIIAEHIHDRKMESVGFMAGGIAHDFKNYIHVIAVSTNAIKGLAQEPGILRRCDLIMDVCGKAFDLTEDIFTLAKSDQGQVSKINLNEEVEKSVALLAETLNGGIELKTSLCKTLPPILGNATQINKVIMNLSNNAKEAIRGSGRIDIKTQKICLNEGDCQRHANARPGEFATMTISDTGQGIAPDSISKIFDPFYSTKNGKNNAGLGLSMVYAIVRNHEGWIDVESKVEQGTRFTLYFPVS